MFLEPFPLEYEADQSTLPKLRWKLVSGAKDN